MMQTKIRGQNVTRESVLKVLREFDALYSDTADFDDWLEKGTYKYAVEYDGKLYPPKYIISQASGLDVSSFSGGEESNRVFRQLGFTVIDKP